MTAYPKTSPSPPTGRRTKKSILSGVSDPYTLAWVSGYNEVTRVTPEGAIIVRLHDTDIVCIQPSPILGAKQSMTVALDNGGWRTPTTRTHMIDALHRKVGPQFNLWHDAKRGGAVFVWFRGTADRHETAFNRVLAFDIDPWGYVTDIVSDLDEDIT